MGYPSGRRGGRTCAAMTMELLTVGSTVRSMTLSFSQLPALRGFPEGPAEAARHRTRRGSLGLLAGGRVVRRVDVHGLTGMPVSPSAFFVFRHNDKQCGDQVVRAASNVCSVTSVRFVIRLVTVTHHFRMVQIPQAICLSIRVGVLSPVLSAQTFQCCVWSSLPVKLSN